MPDRMLDAVVVVLLIAAWVADALVLYLLDDPLVRFYLGLVILMVATLLTVWATRRFTTRQPTVIHQRRFYKLRGRVTQFLSEISRLNGVVIDAQRGIRKPETAKAEIDAIEQRLHEIIHQIRDAAGQAGPPPT